MSQGNLPHDGAASPAVPATAWCPTCKVPTPYHGDPESIHLHLCNICGTVVDDSLTGPVPPATFREVETTLQELKCPTCKGLGKCDDAEAGDIFYRTWTCTACGGSGFAKSFLKPAPGAAPRHAVSDYLRAKVDARMESIRKTLGVPAAPATPLKHGDQHVNCGGQWCDYVREEYKRPGPISLHDGSRIARFVKIGLMCDKCGAEHRAYLPPESWAERAAFCAQGIIRDLLADVTPERGDGTTLGHLRWMAEELADRNVGSDTKVCRWLGYLQAGLVMHKLSTLEREKRRNLDSQTRD